MSLVDECVDIVEKLYKEDKPIKEIVKHCHNSMSVVYKAINRLEKQGRIKRRRRNYNHRGYLSKDELNKIKRMYKQGTSLYAISKKLGRPVSTVYYAVKKLGL
ncbi:MAG: helix-turn-helix domain-containing protein [Desulfurococcales archaeon]|nr:helix-turn-helix domain-containing protein [Desulfurococcales archaeon]